MESSDKRMMKAASLLPGLVMAAWPVLVRADDRCPVLSATHVQVGTQRFRVEVTASGAARERGLSGRASLPADAGMWFVLPAPGLHGFWMKDMAFPIDLVWLSPDRVVLGAERLTPCGPNACPIHYPPAPATYVLEVNAGRFAGRPGDRADWTCSP
jgi:uncharacterized membrane protein (UPF0127 family)